MEFGVIRPPAPALAAYADEQAALANHTVLDHLNTVCRDVAHVAERNPQLAERCAKVLVVRAQRSLAISAGIARAKAKKETPKTG